MWTQFLPPGSSWLWVYFILNQLRSFCDCTDLQINKQKKRMCCRIISASEQLCTFCFDELLDTFTAKRGIWNYGCVWKYHIWPFEGVSALRVNIYLCIIYIYIDTITAWFAAFYGNTLDGDVFMSVFIAAIYSLSLSCNNNVEGDKEKEKKNWSNGVPVPVLFGEKMDFKMCTLNVEPEHNTCTERNHTCSSTPSASLSLMALTEFTRRKRSKHLRFHPPPARVAGREEAQGQHTSPAVLFIS